MVKKFYYLKSFQAKHIINVIISLFNVIMIKSNVNVSLTYLHYQCYFTIHFKIS